MINFVITMCFVLGLIHFSLGSFLSAKGNLESFIVFKVVPIGTGIFLGWLGFHLLYFHP